MRLLEFLRTNFADLEAFFEENHDLRLNVQVIFNQLGRRTTTWRGHCRKSGSIMQVAPLSSLGLSSHWLSLCHPFEPVGAITLLVISVVFNILFSSCRNWSNKIHVWTMSAIWFIFASAERDHLALPQQEELKPSGQTL